MAAALVSYASSDEEVDEEQQPSPPPPPQLQPEIAEAPQEAAFRTPEADKTQIEPAVAPSKPGPPPPPRRETQESPVVTEPNPQSAVPLGPSLPPMDASPLASDDDQAEAPASPYSASRATIHDLTLPSVPNLDIPPSPPGSPPARVSKTFDQFLALKKNGTHFNKKLEQSTALRNPSVMDKLLDFAGLEGQQQYETTVSSDLWDPAAFPESAFVEKLRKSRETLAKEREADRAGSGRSSIDFAPSTTTNAGTLSAAGGLARGEKRKGGWK